MGNAPRNILGVLERLDGTNVHVHQMRCVDVRNRNAGCHACADACVSGAIGLVDGVLCVEPSLCIGCGTCATVCPTCALEARGPDDAALFERCLAISRANDGEMVAVCSRVADAEAGRLDESRCVEVACLGRIDESLLVCLAAEGCESVRLVGRGCERCSHVAGARVAEQVCVGASELLEAWGAPMEIDLVEEVPASVRLEGLDLYAKPAPQSVERMERPACAEPDDAEAQPVAWRPQKVGRDGTLAHHVPTRRGRLLGALEKLGEPVSASITTRLWGTVDIDVEACGSCRMCAVFCPTGALSKFDDRSDGTFGIDHAPADCVKCRCCEAVCPRHAVRIAEEVFAPDIVDGHRERFEMRPPEIAVGKPTTVVNKMRKLLSGSQYVNFA